jgi:formylglycine-generating enzyme required for sulfatase activity
MGSRDGEGFADERPQHRQAIARDFELGKYAVTFEEYESFCAATGREVPGDKNWGKGRRPVINVSWEDAHDYCDWLSAVTGERYRLPSEAEWEYACRAGTETAYSFGDSISKSQARFSEGDLGSAGKTVEVGSFLPNGFGLYDMHGNVWEWCADAWNEDYSGKPAHLKRSGDPWTTGSSSWRVLRGGSWYDVPRLRRSANRGRYYALYRDDDCGFRVARTITP